MIINIILEAVFWLVVLAGVPFVAHYISSHR